MRYELLAAQGSKRDTINKVASPDSTGDRRDRQATCSRHRARSSTAPPPLQPAAATSHADHLSPIYSILSREFGTRLFNSHTCLAGHGVAQVERNKPFRILVVNFGKVERKILPGQAIAQANPHPIRIYESDITHAEILGIIDKDS